ncbi:hypothetical protein NHF56_19625 [Rhizobium sp. L1K21]|nr:hypothetical protein [Rhizobium sp. L1K21]MCO6188429.1 hypothetical protein [Rhizobium sp. L1K21]
MDIHFQPVERQKSHQNLECSSCPAIAKFLAAFLFRVGAQHENTKHFPGLKGFRFPREVVAWAVWAYHRFALSTVGVEDLVAERGVIVSD